MGGGGSSAPAPAKPVYTDPVNGMSFDSAAALNYEIAARKLGENTSSTALSKNTYDQSIAAENAFRGNVGYTPGTSVTGPTVDYADGAITTPASNATGKSTLSNNSATPFGSSKGGSGSSNGGNASTTGANGLTVPGATVYNPYVVTDPSAADPNSIFGKAQSSATNLIDEYFTNQGIDPTAYQSQIAQLINHDASAVPDLASNVGAYFPTSDGASLLGTINSGIDATATNSIDALFKPTYATDVLPNSMLDPAVASAVNAQFDPLSAQLTNAEKRGTLNDAGYQAALAAMNADKTAATSTVNGLASNLLTGYQDKMNSLISGARTTAGSLNAANYQSFDPNSYVDQANQLVAKDQSNLQGDLTNAIGTTSFSDIASLLNAGGAVQGANDPTAANPNGATASAAGGGISPSYIATQVNGAQQRTVGSTGAF